MIYEYILRLFGKDIVQTIAFLPLAIGYSDGRLDVGIQLTNPCTAETHSLVKQGFVFGIEYYISVIVGERKVRSATVIKKLRYTKEWLCNDTLIVDDSLQSAIGVIGIVLSGLDLQDRETVEVFIRASILPDKDFTKSTGLNTDVLWNCYIPRLHNMYVYDKGTLVSYEP